MADEIKAPKATVEQEAQAPADPAPAEQPAKPATDGIGAWFKRTFSGHTNAVFFGLLGLITAILIFTIGFWRALIIALFVFAGVAFGEVLDGDPKIVRTLGKLFSRRN